MPFPVRACADAPGGHVAGWRAGDRQGNHTGGGGYARPGCRNDPLAAYSVRGVPEARVSTPVTWNEVPDVHPNDFTVLTVPARFAEIGDLHQDIDDHVFDIAPLLEWAERDERA